MSDAGLTNGAFYGHFTSKEDLVANVLADELRAQRQSFPSIATSAPTAARRLRCSTRSPAAPPPPDRSSPTNLSCLKRRPAASTMRCLVGGFDPCGIAHSAIPPTHKLAAAILLQDGRAQ
jgi:AcrR family transcriptional regulator